MSRSNIEHHGAAAFQLLQGLLVPPSVAAKNLPGGRTQILKVRRIKRRDCHPATTDTDSPCRCISDTANWLELDWNLDARKESDYDWEADEDSVT